MYATLFPNLKFSGLSILLHGVISLPAAAHIIIITPFDAFKYHVFENIMENGAFARLEQMLHFP